MTIYAQRCLIVAAADAPLARALCDCLAPGGASAGMLVTPASAAGALPATHYISQGAIEDAFADLLPLTTFDEAGTPSTRPGQPETVFSLSQGMVTFAKVNALLKAIDVSEQGPFEALARLNLELVQGENF